jgi:hypothetical protein
MTAVMPKNDSITEYHAKYVACELTRRCASESVEKLRSVPADAQVDLNPHQVEAALVVGGGFGASDDVLGAVECGLDFEKRIAAIYPRWRTPEQIEFEFD